MPEKTTENRLARAFAAAKAEGRIALMPYVTVGYPTLERSKKLIKAIVEAGADGLELGVPFSDPLADGATVQRTSQIALDQGTSLRDAFQLVEELRAEGVDVPLVLMGYTNPFYQFGLEALAERAVEAGVDAQRLAHETVAPVRSHQQCRAHLATVDQGYLELFSELVRLAVEGKDQETHG